MGDLKINFNRRIILNRQFRSIRVEDVQDLTDIGV